MKSCGKRFHDEVGKFRFLNELIKVVSPKYLGTRTPDKVKDKILELLYSWTLGLPQEVKIAEAYQMLKKQGIVKIDPKLPDDTPFSAPPTRPKNGIFEDEEKSKMLARLLKSSHPEDLRAANKLIKEMVQEDQKRMEKISKRVSAIEEVNNNVRLLTEMVTSYSQGETSAGSDELMKELYQRCERMRPMLFRLASDTEDNDEALAEILQANDNLTQVISLYQQLVKGEEVNGDTASGPLPGSTSALLDLSGLDMPPAGSAGPALPSLASGSAQPEQPTSLSLLDDELMSLGLNDPTPPTAPGLDSGGWNSFQSSDSSEPSGMAPKTENQPLPPMPPSSSSGLDDLDLLGKTLLQQSLPPASQQVRWEKQQPAPRLTLRDLQNKNSSSTPTLLPSSSCDPPAPPRPPELAHEISLANITVPLESIRPSDESEAAAPLRHRAARLQPHRPPNSHHTSPAACQSSEGESPPPVQAHFHHGGPDLQRDGSRGPVPPTRVLGKPLEAGQGREGRRRLQGGRRGFPSRRVGRGPQPRPFSLLRASSVPIPTLSWLGLHLERCAPRRTGWGPAAPSAAIHTGVWCFSPWCSSIH
ncbi:ADP-ribosylation factor-binding protein GGA1 isoform X1 [Trichosurus vulpecula]|nr:ADP-ribosylation factor-binding protein GGA1 isoform X1 [Trichosurus vulpecula]